MKREVKTKEMFTTSWLLRRKMIKLRRDTGRSRPMCGARGLESCGGLATDVHPLLGHSRGGVPGRAAAHLRRVRSGSGVEQLRVEGEVATWGGPCSGLEHHVVLCGEEECWTGRYTSPLPLPVITAPTALHPCKPYTLTVAPADLRSSSDVTSSFTAPAGRVGDGADTITCNTGPGAEHQLCSQSAFLLPGLGELLVRPAPAPHCPPAQLVVTTCRAEAGLPGCQAGPDCTATLLTANSSVGRVAGLVAGASYSVTLDTLGRDGAVVLGDPAECFHMQCGLRCDDGRYDIVSFS